MAETITTVGDVGGVRLWKSGSKRQVENEILRAQVIVVKTKQHGPKIARTISGSPCVTDLRGNLFCANFPQKSKDFETSCSHKRIWTDLRFKSLIMASLSVLALVSLLFLLALRTLRGYL